MHDLLDNLIARLAQLDRLHTELLAAVEAKQTAMRRRDLTAIEQQCEQVDHLTTCITRVEQQRRQLVEELRTKLWPDGPQRKITVGEIAAAVGEPYATRLSVLAAKIRQTAERVAHVNHVSEKATAQILEHLHGMFRLIAEVGSEAGLYAPSGRTVPARATHLVDATA